MSAWPHTILILAAVAAPGLARADVDSFTDANGVAHLRDLLARFDSN
jgi:hypothetical protein